MSIIGLLLSVAPFILSVGAGIHGLPLVFACIACLILCIKIANDVDDRGVMAMMSPCFIAIIFGVAYVIFVEAYKPSSTLLSENLLFVYACGIFYGLSMLDKKNKQ